jgi:hypothetical protein
MKTSTGLIQQAVRTTVAALRDTQPADELDRLWQQVDELERDRDQAERAGSLDFRAVCRPRPGLAVHSQARREPTADVEPHEVGALRSSVRSTPSPVIRCV